MWCKNCNIETNEKTCPICGSDTIEDIPVEVFWCDECKIPIIRTANQMGKEECPICGGKARYFSSDLRPVFPEERLLLALLRNQSPNEYMGKPVWAANSRYYIDGKSVSLSTSTFRDANTDAIAKKLESTSSFVDYSAFTKETRLFVEANRQRLDYLKDEAYTFIKTAAAKFNEESIVISFSGGKDSTVTADLVTKALSNPSLVHIFGNTTLEFPSTIEYANRFRDSHPLAIFQIAKNDEQVFYDVRHGVYRTYNINKLVKIIK